MSSLRKVQSWIGFSLITFTSRITFGCSACCFAIRSDLYHAPLQCLRRSKWGHWQCAFTEKKNVRMENEPLLGAECLMNWHTIFRIFSQTDPWRDCLRDSFGHSLFFYLRISKWQSLTNLELNLNNCRLVLFMSHVLVCRAKAKLIAWFFFLR